MALTPSTMLPLGTPLPRTLFAEALADGSLEPVAGAPLDPAALGGRPLLVLFLCAHCPFVVHIEPELSRLQAHYGDRLQVIGLSSNSTLTHPQDGPEGLRAQALRCGWTFPYLLDRDQRLAHAFRAACTPDPFLFDADLNLAYRGQLDGSRPGNAVPLDGRDLRAAVDALLAGRPVDPQQTPSIGCNIKWPPGGEPAWAR
ncbi:MAG: thioredoxin family protein [Synechococcus sp.]